ncbi:rhamnogalacturonan acetylesterase [Caulobacter sp. BK020]|uniref:rhamnogalacturonan acetylesterase n=1 Tax=Caulobacter sp. BK020 TaxID=2512117 RepID=UPI00104FF1CA|nr:rhamnogalacturonan acetylesterase [Caulobacter sp. BK020]TCS15947.1 lysophospholipase L1-like esterase [Caulobacter sp. BK020]
MRFKALLLAGCLAAGALGAAGARAQTPVPDPAPRFNAIKIVLVGDSTTAVQGGWGPSFCAKHVTSFAACINLARGGRSSGNYRTEGSWALAMDEIRSGGFNDTYVLVQFGHNDQPGKPGRSTDLAMEFPANMKLYVEDVRAAGGKPVLVTPLTRRQFKDGKLVDDLEPWAQAVRKVAAETGTPLVDLHADSAAAVQAMGAAEATRFAQKPPSPEVLAAARTGTTIAASTGVALAGPANADQKNAAVEPMGQAKLSFDYTHLGETGADYFATMVTADLAKAVPALRRFLIP